MLSFLVMVRDGLIALALAWVGVSLEQRTVESQQCAGEACQQQRDR
jgi:hypothetical protein